MALCSNCGKDNRDGSRFCQACGTPLVPPDAARTKPQASGGPVAKRPSQELAMGPVCSSCGTLNAPGMKFCKMCGSPLEAPPGQPAKITCPSCGGQTPGAYKFCQHCGTPLKAAPAPIGPTPGAPVPITPGPAPITPAPIAPIAPAPAPITPGVPAPSSRPHPTPTPLQAALTPAVEPIAVAKPSPAAASYPDVARTLVPAPAPAPPAASPAEPDTARTIIELQSAKPADLAELWGVKPETAAPAPAAVPAPVTPAPIAPPPALLAVAGAIQSSEPAVAKGAAGKATLGPGAARPAVEASLVDRQPLARLISVNRDGTDGEVHLISEESVDLGRCEGQLTFADDPYLSDRHCRFFIQNGMWMVQDLQSCNGVFARLKAIFELKHGDRVLLGKQVFAFEWLSEQERNLSPAVEHGVLVFGSPLRIPWARLRQVTVAGVSRDIYYLYRSKIVMGREEGDLTFPDDEFMSRRHLTISMVGTKALLEDLGSSNGTFLRARDQQPVAFGDMLRVGDQLLRFDVV